jgi:hypothetical protein
MNTLTSPQGDVVVMDGMNITFFDKSGRIYWTNIAYNFDGIPARYAPAPDGELEDTQ